MVSKHLRTVKHSWEVCNIWQKISVRKGLNVETVVIATNPPGTIWFLQHLYRAGPRRGRTWDDSCRFKSYKLLSCRFQLFCIKPAGFGKTDRVSKVETVWRTGYFGSAAKKPLEEITSGYLDRRSQNSSGVERKAVNRSELLLDELDEMRGIDSRVAKSNRQEPATSTRRWLWHRKSESRIGIERLANRKLHLKCLELNCRAKWQEP